MKVVNILIELYFVSLVLLMNIVKIVFVYFFGIYWVDFLSISFVV